MKKRLFLFLIAGALLCGLFVVPAGAQTGERTVRLTQDEEAYLASAPTLNIGFRRSGKPVTYQNADGSFAGIAPACLDLLGEKSGLKFHYILMDDDTDVRASLSAGNLDAVVSFSDLGGGFGSGVQVSPSLLSVPMVLVINRKADYSASSPLTFVQKKGFETASAHIRALNPENKVLYLDTPDLDGCLRAVSTGWADATFMNTYTASYLLQRPQYQDLQVLPQISFTQYLCLAMSGDADPRMVSIIDKTIAAFTSPEIQNIALANTAGVRYQNTLLDSFYEYKLPLALSALLIAFILLGAWLLLNQRNKYVAKLEQTNRDLERASREKTELMSRVSHELRSPVNAISGLSALALDSSPDAASAAYFRKISSSSQYLTGILSDILDMNKIESGSIVLVPSPTSLDTVLDDLNTLVSTQAGQKHVTYAVHDEAVTTRTALCDKTRLEQILINLLTNAVKFTPAGGRVTLSVRQELTEEQMKVDFIVQDTGCGMSADFLPKLFQPYAQENRDPSLYGAGTGLGLAISRNLARLMGGDITVTSAEGEGSTFTASVLLSQCPASVVPPEPADLAGRRALLAEDHSINTEVALGLLRRLGITADAVSDGTMEVEQFRRSPVGTYDVILTDLGMPGMDGFEAVRAIRALPRPDAASIPIVALTGEAREKTRRQALDVGMNGVVTKPIDPKQLAELLRQLLAQPSEPSAD